MLLKDDNYDFILNNYIGLPFELNKLICNYLYTKIFIKINIGIKIFMLL